MTERRQQKIFIVDDDEAVRDSMSLLLDTVNLPHQCFSSAIEFLENYDRSQPGCLILDIRMPGMNGLELLDRLKEMGQFIPIIFITGHGDVPMAVEAMRKGALDFLRKPIREQDLLDRIQEALEIEAGTRNEMMEKENLINILESLTPREKEVFERVAEGQANKVIGMELDISERTVEAHRSQVMKKLGVRTLADLVKIKIISEKCVS